MRLKALLLTLILALCLAGGRAMTATYTDKRFHVTASADDAYSYGPTWPPATTDALTVSMSYIGRSTTNYLAACYRVLLRIPAGATITSAVLNIYGYAANATEDAVYVGIEPTVDPAAYAVDGAREPGAIAAAYITAGEPNKVAWTLGAWTQYGIVTSPDLSALIQSVVDLEGWATGDDHYVSLIIYPQNRSALSANASHRAYSWDGSATSYTPHLTVTYTSDVAPVTNTWYLDPTAAAGGDGSLATPFDAVADLPATVLRNGDTVYFARGGTYAGSWAITGNDLTIDAYGTGAKPIMTGAGAGAANTCIAWTRADGVSISNLGFTTSGIGIQGNGSMNGITIEDCDFTTTHKGINLTSGSTPDLLGQNVVIRRNTFTGINQGGTAGGDIGFSRFFDDVLIEYNTGSDGVDFVVLGSGAVADENCHRWIIRYNTGSVYTENFVDLKNFKPDTWANRAQIYGNVTSNASASGWPTATTRYSTYNIQDSSKYVEIFNNRDDSSGSFLIMGGADAACVSVYNNVGSNGKFEAIQIGSEVAGPFFIDNNTLAYYGAASDGYYGVSILGGLAGAEKSTFRNNILYHVGKGRANGFTAINYAADENNITVQNNIHWPWNGEADVWRLDRGDNGGYEYLTVAEAAARFTAGTWTGNTWEGEQFADPKLVNPAGGNFRPRANSPARDAGVAVDGREQDAGRRGMRGRAWDIGAYEAIDLFGPKHPVWQTTQEVVN